MFPYLSFHTCRRTIAGAPGASQPLTEGSPIHARGAAHKETCLWTPGPLNPLPSFNLVLLLYHLLLHSFSISYKGRTGAALKKKKKQTQKIFKSNIDFLRFSTVPLSLNLHHLHKFDWLDILLHWSFRNFRSFNAFFFGATYRYRTLTLASFINKKIPWESLYLYFKLGEIKVKKGHTKQAQTDNEANLPPILALPSSLFILLLSNSSDISAIKISQVAGLSHEGSIRKILTFLKLFWALGIQHIRTTPGKY